MNCVFNILAKTQAVVHLRVRVISRVYKKQNLVNTIESMLAQRPEGEFSNEGTAIQFGRYPAHHSRIEVVGSGAHGGPTCVYFSARDVPYLFNCGEGSQRLCSEYRIKLSKIQHAFITYPSWKNIMGLFGVLLELQGEGMQDFHIYGHPHIANIFKESNKFVALRKIALHFEDIFDENDIVFDNVQIKKVFLFPSSMDKDVSKPESPSTSLKDIEKEQKLCEDYDDEGVDYYSHLLEGRKRCQIILKHKNEKRSKLEFVTNQNIEIFALSYICRLKKILGTLLIEKCVTLGVPPGQLLGQLKNGVDITLDDGRVIKSSDVKSPDIPGDVVIFVECPSEDYLDSLLSEPKFIEHQSNKTKPELLATVVVHFTSCEVMENPKYKEWMSRFPTTTKHVVVNESNKWTGSVGIHRLQVKMNLVHPEVFPLLHESKIVFQDIGIDKIKEDSKIIELSKPNEQEKSNHKLDEEGGTGIGKFFYQWDKNSVIQGDGLCSVFLKPKKDYDYSKLYAIKDFFLDEAFQNEGLKEELDKLKLVLKEMESVTDGNEYPKILFLGTGSSKPSKARNTSGILVFLDETNSMLFDCGEASYCQLVRFYGKDKAREILRNLKAVFISHLHPDHHLGLITILLQRKKLFMDMDRLNAQTPDADDKNPLTSSPKKGELKHEPLPIVGPGQIIKWLRVVDRDLEKISNTYELIPNDLLQYDKKVDELSEKLFKLTNLHVTTAFVRHVANSFGIAVTHKDGWKLTYSGDTMPCDSLIKIGKDCDVLIHEATLDNSLKHEAVRKSHSTNAQAIKVGMKMNAKFTLLTHFSQRYHYSPIFNEYFTENVGVAYDNMLVSIKQLKILPKMRNVLKVLFLTHYEKLIETSNKKQRNNERVKLKGSVSSR